MDRFEVGVIGAGVHGASAAYHLASMGVSTTIVERSGPAQGPTGRSSGICRAYYTNPFLAAVAHRSIGMLEGFRELTGRDSGFRRTGFLFLQGADEVARVREVSRHLDEVGVVTELLDEADLTGRFPAFEMTGIGVGVWERDAGYADPAATTLGLFSRAVELGAVPTLGRAAVGIDRAPGGWEIALSDGGRLACEKVLIAAGPWTRALAATVGADLPLTVERHAVAVFAWNGVEPVVAHADVGAGYYVRPDGEDQYLAGWLHPAPEVDADRFAERIADDEVEALVRPIVERVPHLEGSSVQGGWASLYDVSPDWQPMIGEVAPGVFVDAGTSGHGFKLAPALGEHVARLVLGSTLDPRLSEFDPARFERGRPLEAGFGAARILG
ncbi:MAG TPA: FAD-binding oxidoreductase [Actinomycetota bacterium]|nr:FAD-binding oxidoreductase [Actinomycetota bacterium]